MCKPPVRLPASPLTGDDESQNPNMRRSAHFNVSSRTVADETSPLTCATTRRETS